MKVRVGLVVALVAIALAGAAWFAKHSGSASGVAKSPGSAVPRPATTTPAEPKAPPAAAAPVRVKDPDAGPPSTPTVASPDPPETREGVEGRVVDVDGHPVALFFVEARPFRTNRRRSRDDDDDVRRIAGSRGVFSLAELTEGEWTLVARGSHDARSPPLRGRIPWQGDPPLLTLQPAVRVDGIVLGRGEAPVDGASVYLAYAGEEIPTPGSGHDDFVPKAKSDGNGRFSIPSVRPGRLFLLATHPDYCNSDYLRVDLPPEGGPEQKLRLRKGARVTGVVDPSMGATGNRDVHLYSFNGLIGWRKTRSDESGHFDFLRVIPQNYVIELKAEDELELTLNGLERKDDGASATGAPKNLGLRKQITTREGETTTVTLGEVKRNIRGHGRITCRGAPLADAEVSYDASKSTDSLTQRVSTAADGSFEIGFAGAGSYTLHVYWKSSFHYFDVSVPDQESVDVSHEVPAGSLSGRLTGADGNALARVHVTLMKEDRDPSRPDAPILGPDHRSYSREDGSFDFFMLPPGSYTLAAPDGQQFERPVQFDPHGRVFRRGLRVGDDPVTDVVLRLGPESRITGRVVDGLGQPSGGAHLLLTDDEGRSCSTWWEADADESGNFEIRCVAAGRYHVVAWRDQKSGRSETVTVEPETTAETTVHVR